MYEPGKLGFDPFGLYPVEPKAQKNAEEAEIWNGRLAMLVVLSYSWDEWVTKIAVVVDTPWFFAPISSSIEMLEETGAEEAPFVFASLQV